jgi:hypothetical protein
MGFFKGITQTFAQALPFTAAIAGLPAGVAGVLAGKKIGSDVASALNPASAATALTGAIEPPPTEEQLEDQHKRRKRQEMIDLAKEHPGRRQTALLDATQSAFPFRLY